MNFKHKPRKVLITGASGSGKSRLALTLVQNWRGMDGKPPKMRFIFDVEGEYAQRVPGTRRALHWSEFSGQQICFDPCQTFAGEPEKGFDFFCDFTFSASTQFKGPKLFFTDELQDLIGTNLSETPKSLRTMLNTGRRYELDFCAVCQAPNQIHGRVRNQMTEIFCFQQVDENAMRFVESLGMNGVQELKPGEFLRKMVKTGQLDKGTVNLKTGEIKIYALNSENEKQRPICDEPFGKSGSGKTHQSAKRTRPTPRRTRRGEEGGGAVYCAFSPPQGEPRKAIQTCR
jgi:hypothetical protein